jgi:hypothetical protein
LFWRFAAGLYYDLITIPKFANPFGESYQSYVGSVLRAAAPSRTIFDEHPYNVGSKQKGTVDWIVADVDGSALFIECKVKRARREAKQRLSDISALEEDIGHLAAAVVQSYKTKRDCLAGHYPHFQTTTEREHLSVCSHAGELAYARAQPAGAGGMYRRRPAQRFVA